MEAAGTQECAQQAIQLVMREHQIAQRIAKKAKKEGSIH